MKLQRLLDVLDRLHPRDLAADWDRVGLVCGDPEEDVTRVLLALDPVPAVGAQALREGAQLVVTHHPLYLRGTSSVAALDPKGRLVHRLIRAGCALHAAHTNADAAPTGTNATLARLLDLREVRALHPLDTPEGADLTDLLGPDAAADPALRGDGLWGMGRVGILPTPMTLAAFADRVAAVLPGTVPGVLASGPAGATVRTVAVCTGAGESYLADARAVGADVYLTADLRHHPASEHVEAGAPWLVDATHYATEAIMMPPLADALRAAAAHLGETLEVIVSTAVTDPWTYRAPGLDRPNGPDRHVAPDAPSATDPTVPPATEGARS